MANVTSESKDDAKPLLAHHVAMYDDLCKTYCRSDRRADEHWLAKFALERYDQIMPALLAALSDEDREAVKKHIEAVPW